MSSLAKYYSSNLIGFFTYSREDDVDFGDVLSKFRNAIQAELSAQLGRNRDNFRIWQDKFAIPHGGLWQKQIVDGIKQSAFFIPIITPRVVNSPHCAFEFNSFLSREKELGRDDLVFPILYISVPELDDGTWQQSSVLKIVSERQYLDWRNYRPRELTEPEVRRELIQFCQNISNALRKPWESPEERRQRQEPEAARVAPPEERSGTAPAEAGQVAEAERPRYEAAAGRAAQEERKEATAAEAQARETARRTEDERQRRETAASAAETRAGNLAEAPAFALAAVGTQNASREPSDAVVEHAASKVSRKSWWQTLPGMLIAVGGLLVGATALVLALNHIGVFTGAPPPASNAGPQLPQVTEHLPPQAPQPQVANQGVPAGPLPQTADHVLPSAFPPQGVPVAAPSFDCKTDRKPVEQAICNDAELSSKDRALNDIFHQMLAGLSGQARTDLIQAETNWVTKNRNQCRDPGMAACIAQSYDARIRELQAMTHR